jgi:hypothetical protein
MNFWNVLAIVCFSFDKSVPFAVQDLDADWFAFHAILALCKICVETMAFIVVETLFVIMVMTRQYSRRRRNDVKSSKRSFQ